jgi:D-3-phosphoglycerate dehydrogenase
MLGMKEQFLPIFEEKGIEVYCPDVVQTLSEEELIDLIPEFDGWIIGDDPATRTVFEAGKAGKLKAAVKWGVGVDNVDFEACKDLNIPIIHTPNMFGPEVADIAVHYVTALARETYFIDRKVREGLWPKNQGISLAGKTVGVVGYGDIGKNTVKRLIVADMKIIVFDPLFDENQNADDLKFSIWPKLVGGCDFLVFTCSLTRENRHMLNKDVLLKTKKGVRIVNVSRGGLIDEVALINALESGHVHSVALDVFEKEPLSENSALRKYDKCIFGSHNASNTSDAVIRTSELAINTLFNFLGL